MRIVRTHSSRANTARRSSCRPWWRRREPIAGRWAVGGAATLWVRPAISMSIAESTAPLPAREAAHRSAVGRRTLRSWIASIGPALALGAVILAFSLLTGAPARYLSPFNLRIVLSQTAIVAVGAIGMTMIIVGGG